VASKTVAASLTAGVATAQLGGTDNDPTKPASPTPADIADPAAGPAADAADPAVAVAVGPTNGG
jgi:hypothetical protein